MRRTTPLKRKTALRPRPRSDNTYERELDALTPALKQRSKGRCEICVVRNAVHRHHRRLRTQGGTNELSNLLHLCNTCHRLVHDNPATSYQMGWLLRRES